MKPEMGQRQPVDSGPFPSARKFTPYIQEIKVSKVDVAPQIPSQNHPLVLTATCHGATDPQNIELREQKITISLDDQGQILCGDAPGTTPQCEIVRYPSGIYVQSLTGDMTVNELPLDEAWMFPGDQISFESWNFHVTQSGEFESDSRPATEESADCEPANQFNHESWQSVLQVIERLEDHITSTAQKLDEYIAKHPEPCQEEPVAESAVADAPHVDHEADEHNFCADAESHHSPEQEAISEWEDAAPCFESSNNEFSEFPADEAQSPADPQGCFEVPTWHMQSPIEDQVEEQNEESNECPQANLTDHQPDECPVDAHNDDPSDWSPVDAQMESAVDENFDPILPLDEHDDKCHDVEECHDVSSNIETDESESTGSGDVSEASTDVSTSFEVEIIEDPTACDQHEELEAAAQDSWEVQDPATDSAVNHQTDHEEHHAPSFEEIAQNSAQQTEQSPRDLESSNEFGEFDATPANDPDSDPKAETERSIDSSDSAEPFDQTAISSLDAANDLINEFQKAFESESDLTATIDEPADSHSTNPTGEQPEVEQAESEGPSVFSPIAPVEQISECTDDAPADSESIVDSNHGPVMEQADVEISDNEFDAIRNAFLDNPVDTNENDEPASVEDAVESISENTVENTENDCQEPHTHDDGAVSQSDDHVQETSAQKAQWLEQLYDQVTKHSLEHTWEEDRSGTKSECSFESPEPESTFADEPTDNDSFYPIASIEEISSIEPDGPVENTPAEDNTPVEASSQIEADPNESAWDSLIAEVKSGLEEQSEISDEPMDSPEQPTEEEVCETPSALLESLMSEEAKEESEPTDQGTDGASFEQASESSENPSTTNESVAEVLARMQMSGTWDVDSPDTPEPVTEEPQADATPEQPSMIPSSEAGTDTVQDYMSQLFERLRTGDGEESSSSQPEPTVASAPASSPVSSQPTMATEQPVEEQGEEDSLNPVNPLSNAEYKPQQKAPEKLSTLTALRQVANQSVQTAIAKSVKQKKYNTSMIYLAGTGVCFFLSTVMFIMCQAWFDFCFLCGIIFAVLCAGFGFMFMSVNVAEEKIAQAKENIKSKTMSLQNGLKARVKSARSDKSTQSEE